MDAVDGPKYLQFCLCGAHVEPCRAMPCHATPWSWWQRWHGDPVPVGAAGCARPQAMAEPELKYHLFSSVCLPQQVNCRCDWRVLWRDEWGALVNTPLVPTQKCRTKPPRRSHRADVISQLLFVKQICSVL